MTDCAKENPLVTFVVFAYNQENYIREAVEGALVQTYEPLEIILSDDCSSDRTFEIMQEMAVAYDGPHAVKVRQNIINLGFADHINEVHSRALGQFITWSAGDDIALSERTEMFINALRKNDLNLVHSPLIKIDLQGRELGVKVHPCHVRQPSMRSVVVQKRGVVTQSFCFRKEAFDVFGNLSRTVMHEAIVYGFRAASLGKILYLPEPLTKYRIGSGVSTSKHRHTRLNRQEEAIKVSRWRMTALHQIRKDVTVATKIESDPEIEDLIKSETKKWEFIHSINNMDAKGIYAAISDRYFFDRDVIRAFGRTFIWNSIIKSIHFRKLQK